MIQAAIQMADDAERQIARLEHELSALKRRVAAGRSAVVFGPCRMPPDVRSILSARRAREQLISRELFADPAWDILLELYAANLEQRKISTSDLCIASAVPATTALRWIDKLHHMGFLLREEDRFDRRRVLVTLSPAGRARMQSYFEALPGAFGTV
jgi:DNA-binding MarR family transcriptional regulator